MVDSNQDLMNEFVGRVEKTLSSKLVKDKLIKLYKKVDILRAKRQKLLDSFLSGLVLEDMYKEKDENFKNELREIEQQIEENELLRENDAVIIVGEWWNLEKHCQRIWF